MFKYVAAFGKSYPATGETLLPSHRFRIASISKPITAAAIMKLIESGQLTRKRKVFGPKGVLNGRFPLPANAPQQAWLKAITIDHLLSHTCGGWTNNSADPMFGNITLGHDALIRKTLAEQPLLNPPGTVYAYSNFGYCLLGRVIEVLSGESYADYTTRVILKPAGARLAIGGNTLSPRLRNEVVYVGQSGENPYNMNVTRMDAHGGWVGTASDLVRFGNRVDGYSTVRDLISQKSVAAMRTPTAQEQWYGRGWTVSPFHSNRWHTGSLPGTTTILVLVDGGHCFAGLVNTRRWSPNINVGLDTLMWNIYAQVMN